MVLHARAVILHAGDDIGSVSERVAYSLTSCFCWIASFFQITASW